jgi:hypothetical protein
LSNVTEDDSVIERVKQRRADMTIDFDSFTTEPARGERPKRRVIAVLGASMLVAGAGGVGFGLGRAGGSDAVVVAPAAAPPDTVPVIETDGPVVTELAVIEPTVGNDVAAATISADASIESSGGGGYSTFGNQPTQLIAERVTDSGITLRAHLGQLYDQSDYLSSEFGVERDWSPPGWCFESGQVRIALGGGEATGQNVIDVGAVSWWTEPFQDRAISWLTLGTADGNPHRIVFVQASSDVTSVTVTHGDGSTDSVVPIDGVAMLVVPGAPESIQHDEGGSIWNEEVHDFDVTFDGPEPVTVADAHVNSQWNDPEFSESCQPPPPALPEPGDQPTNPAAAQQTITDTMATIYGSPDSETNGELIDDPTGIAEARQQVRDGDYEEAAANAEAIVEELVFTTPTEAWFRYRIETTTGTFDRRYGIAVEIDGVWKITRNTICQDLQLAGGDCGGRYVDNITPPGQR